MKMGWPYPRFDMDQEVERLKSELGPLVKKIGINVTLYGWDVVSDMDGAKSLEKEINGADGLILIYLTSGTGDLISTIVGFGLPTILYAQPYSGHYWTSARQLREAKKRVLVVASSDLKELVEKVRLLYIAARLRHAKFLAFGNFSRDESYQRTVQTVRPYLPHPIDKSYLKSIKEKLGVEVKVFNYKRIDDAYASVSVGDAARLAEKVIDEAEGIVEPSRKDVIAAVRLYLALKKIIKEEGADAITIDCLPMLSSREGMTTVSFLSATPCLAFSMLNDEGMPAACEADLDSLLTMFIFRHLTGKPSFISDPVVDVGKNRVIHAHCTSPRRMRGFELKPEPFMLRNHSESHTSVSLQVKMREGQEITAAKLVGLEKIIASKGKITANPDVERACRTKVETKITDVKTFIKNFTGGLHRVIVYGDYLRELENLSKLLALDFIIEA